MLSVSRMILFLCMHVCMYILLYLNIWFFFGLSLLRFKIFIFFFSSKYMHVCMYLYVCVAFFLCRFSLLLFSSSLTHVDDISIKNELPASFYGNAVVSLFAESLRIILFVI